jgi:acyl carrier protein
VIEGVIVLPRQGRRPAITDSRRPDVQGPQLDDTLRSVVARHLDVHVTDVTVDTSLEEIQVDDELGHVLLGAVGDELEVIFPDDFLDGLDTYGQLCSAVRLAVGV